MKRWNRGWPLLAGLLILLLGWYGFDSYRMALKERTYRVQAETWNQWTNEVVRALQDIRNEPLAVQQQHINDWFAANPSAYFSEEVKLETWQESLKQLLGMPPSTEIIQQGEGFYIGHREGRELYQMEVKIRLENGDEYTRPIVYALIQGPDGYRVAYSDLWSYMLMQ